MLKRIYVDILMAVGERGGVEAVVNKTATYLDNQGFHMRVVQLVWEGIHWVEEPVEFYPLLEGRGRYSLEKFVGSYTKFLAEHGKPDIILATTWPVLVLVAKMSIMRLNRGWSKIVSWLHGPLEKYVSAGYGGIECLKETDAVFVLNEKTKKIIETYGEGCNVTVVKNPVDFNRCKIKKENNWKKKTLLFVGRLSQEKRIDIILHALEHTRERWQLILIGDGDERNRLLEIVKSLHLEKQVQFLGWKTNPWEYAKGISALVLASEYESFSLVTFESLASGIPVISTPVDGVTEVIKPGINGFFFPAGDSRGLADILDAVSSGKLPATDPEVCRETVKNYEEKRVLAEFKEKLEEVWAD